MSDSATPNAPLAAAAQSLRDTAKWLVGGVTATAASIFAGSSLTNLGSLDPATDTARLAAAVGGIIVGFVALGVVFRDSVRVLTRDSITLRELAASEKQQGDLAMVAASITARYQHSLPNNIQSLADYVTAVDNHRMIEPPTETSLAFLRDAECFQLLAMPDACFLVVRNRFERLVRTLPLSICAAAVGFGLFAWAANPPGPQAPKTEKGMTIRLTF
jgi:hypothetical protein